MKTLNTLSAIGPELTAQQINGVTGGLISIINAWPKKYTGM